MSTLHLHPCYPASCGQPGIHATNDKDINCPACLFNMAKEKGDVMQLDHFKAEYSKFDAEFFPDATVEDVEAKIIEEIDELAIEIINNGPREAKIAECLDVLNMSIKLLERYGVKDQLHAGWQKLQANAERYRAERIANAAPSP